MGYLYHPILSTCTDRWPLPPFKSGSFWPRLRQSQNTTTNMNLTPSLSIQNAVSCQVPNLIHGLNRLQPKVPVPDATTTRWGEEGQQTERQGETRILLETRLVWGFFRPVDDATVYTNTRHCMSIFKHPDSNRRDFSNAQIFSLVGVSLSGGRSVFPWTTKRDLLRFTVINVLLIVKKLFNDWGKMLFCAWHLCNCCR